MHNTKGDAHVALMNMGREKKDCFIDLEQYPK